MKSCLLTLTATPAQESSSGPRRSVTGKPQRLDRFMAKVHKTDDCWIWTAAKDTAGYGRFWDGSRITGAHQWAHRTFIGPIPDDYDIDHLCRVRVCVNPKHLEAVTRRENLLRANGIGVINAAKTHCPQGHEYSPSNIYQHKTGRRCKTCCDSRMKQYRKTRKAISG